MNINSEAYIVNPAIYVYETIHDVETFNRAASNIYQLAPRFPGKSCVRIDSFPINPSTWRSRTSTTSRLAVSSYLDRSRLHIYFRFLASISLRSRDIGGRTGRQRERERKRKRDCRENVIWIRSYDESNRNSAERTRHRLEIRFAGGDGVKGASGDMRTRGRLAPRLIVHSWGIYSVSP